MSFRCNDSQQISMNDRLLHLINREKKVLEKSWAKDFADEIFSAIERLNRELKRRSKVIGIFPSSESLMRLIGAVIINAMICSSRQNEKNLYSGNEENQGIRAET